MFVCFGFLLVEPCLPCMVMSKTAVHVWWHHNTYFWTARYSGVPIPQPGIRKAFAYIQGPPWCRLEYAFHPHHPVYECYTHAQSLWTLHRSSKYISQNHPVPLILVSNFSALCTHAPDFCVNPLTAYLNNSLTFKHGPNILYHKLNFSWKIGHLLWNLWKYTYAYPEVCAPL